ncbi:helix-turn-helix transcriptional regulator [Nostocoides jenkinsii]|uniref:Putative transcriptional regulator n=1 Tax=Nostocoides jenkinsii Ben 74 TaxID=1193518 RepID=A0A077MG30_9MICO|nr:transcriptional regulator [Tetrasphaera jenkinsii]CCI54378.1 putative transcriptional regulator [Tetrasphaera jenkinsii Ben 74]
MANTSSRTLRLLTLLQTHRFWPGPELADRLEVSERTLRRDVDRLRDLGYPVSSTRGIEGGYQLGSGGSLPPLVVDEDEAIAMVVALGAAANTAVGGLGEATLSSLAKVVQVLPAPLRRRAEALRAATVDSPWGQAPEIEASVLAVLAQAIRDTERVVFSYTARSGAGADARVERHAEPVKLVTVGRRWYLVGYDLDRGAWRSFRLDRLADPRGTRARFRPREIPGGDPAAFVRSGLRQAGREEDRVRARVALPAAEAEARIGRWATISALDETTCEVHLTARDAAWVLVALGKLDAHFTIEEASPAMLDTLRSWTGRMALALP